MGYKTVGVTTYPWPTSGAAGARSCELGWRVVVQNVTMLLELHRHFAMRILIAIVPLAVQTALPNSWQQAPQWTRGMNMEERR